MTYLFDKDGGVTNLPELNNILHNLYMIYRNEYLTVEKMGEHYNISPVMLRDMLRLGEEIHNYRAGEVLNTSPINTQG